MNKNILNWIQMIIGLILLLGCPFVIGYVSYLEPAWYTKPTYFAMAIFEIIGYFIISFSFFDLIEKK